MSMTKNELQTYLEVDDWNQLDSALTNCQLATDPNSSYSSEEVTLVENYLEVVVNPSLTDRYKMLLSEGRSPSDVLTLLKEELSTESPTESKDLESISPDLTLFKLIEKAGEAMGQSLSLSRTLEFLKLSGLTEKESYSSSEAERFFHTCDLVVKQGKSYSEVSQINGVEDVTDSLIEQASSYTQNRLNEWGTSVATSTAQTEEEVAEAVNRMHIQSLGEYLNSDEMTRKIQEARQKILQKRQRQPGQILREFEAWETSKRKQWKLEGSDSTIKVLPSTKD